MFLSDSNHKTIPAHDPMACRGDNGGLACFDDPCWGCIMWAFEKLEEMGITYEPR